MVCTCDHNSGEVTLGGLRSKQSQWVSSRLCERVCLKKIRQRVIEEDNIRPSHACSCTHVNMLQHIHMQCTHRRNELMKHFIQQNLALGKGSDSAMDINVRGSDLHNVCANMSSNCLILQGILPLPRLCCKACGFCVVSTTWRCNEHKTSGMYYFRREHFIMHCLSWELPAEVFTVSVLSLFSGQWPPPNQVTTCTALILLSSSGAHHIIQDKR